MRVTVSPQQIRSAFEAVKDDYSGEYSVLGSTSTDGDQAEVR